MGLGVYFQAVSKRGVSAPEILSNIREELSRIVNALPLLDWTTLTDDENRIYLMLHPAGEHVEFFLDEGDKLICSATTSTCGPGYHAYLIDVLDQLAGRVHVSWQGVDNEGSGDETDYCQTRSFEELQRQMLMWLRAVASYFVQPGDRDFIMVNMPLNFGMLVDQPEGVCITPLGPFPSDWFRRIASEDAELFRSGGEFFPWWNKSCDATFWKRLALVQSWCNVAWTSPQTAEQEDVCRLTLAAFDTARQLDQQLTLPELEIDELRQLLTTETDAPPIADKNRIGYRRLTMRRSLPGGWTIEVPGHLEILDEDEGATTVYWFAGRTLRGSSLTMKKKGTPPRPAGEILDDMFAKETEEEEMVFDERSAEPPGFAVTSFVNDGEEEYWRLRGYKARPGGLCIVTVCYPCQDEAAWALRAWRSLKAPANDP